jgi:tRNA-dihydrouridine synthase A
MPERANPRHRLCVAPMMDRTDRHCRYFLRLAAPDAWLYTEMLTAAAVSHGRPERLLRFHAAEHPVAVQLGGSDPAELARAASIAERAGFDEINLNIGCPSDRVQAGCFGAALMGQPARVADCVAAMKVASALPVTVKTRLGIDDHDSYEFLHRFVACVTAAGCDSIFVHARKAWLKGLSPKENRELPELDYGRVHRLKRNFPDVEVVINGGLSEREPTLAQLEHVDGIMLGRAAYRDPCLLADLNRRLFPASRTPTREQLLEAMLPYIDAELGRGTPLRAITRHLMGLYAGQSGARRWRRMLSDLPDSSAALGVLERHLTACIAA